MNGAEMIDSTDDGDLWLTAGGRWKTDVFIKHPIKL